MFSSKTTNLLAAIDRSHHQDLEIAVFKPQLDTRYSESFIESHSGGKYPAISISSGLELRKAVDGMDKRPDVIAVDEIFMIDGIADELISLFRQGISIYASSIDMSAGLSPFEEVQRLMPWCTSIVKLTAVCNSCKADALYTHRNFKVADDSKIVTGGKDLYEARCFKCHPLIKE